MLISSSIFYFYSFGVCWSRSAWFTALTRPLHHFSSCWLSLTNRRFKSRWVELMWFKPELEMLGKVLEMESLERSEAHSFDPQTLFAHILSSWFETLAMFHMGIHYCTVYMTGNREKHKCSPPTTVCFYLSLATYETWCLQWVGCGFMQLVGRKHSAESAAALVVKSL